VIWLAAIPLWTLAVAALGQCNEYLIFVPGHDKPAI
jgi:hypothetical protein